MSSLIEIHKRVEKIEVLRLEHILKETGVKEGAANIRYNKLQDFLKILDYEDLDDYNNSLIEFA